MIGKKLEELACVLMENESNPDVDKEIIVYGLSCAIEYGASIITSIVLGLLFGLTLEIIVFLMSFSFIRTYVGGYHCKKAINCYLMSNGVIILVLAVIKFTPEGYMLFLGIAMLLLAIPVLMKLEPVETPSKPLDEAEQKHYYKKYLCT